MSDTDNSAINEIETLLKAELERTQAGTKRSMIIAGVMVVVVGGYLSWVHSQVTELLNPDGIALAATGLAIDAVPQGGEYLHTAIVDGAPDIARAASQGVLDMLPAYRTVLEEELAPVIDEVCGILATTAVDSVVRSAGTGGAASQQLALQEGADAVFVRLDAMLDEAMDAPTTDEDENVEGPSPRETIDVALHKLKTVDSGLKKIASGRGDAAERELLLTWMALLTQYQDEANVAATDAHRDGERVED
jgi:hypothetical protein